MIDAEVVDALWGQIEPIAYITRDQFVRGLADWSIESARFCDRLAFVFLARGPEFHFASFDTGATVTLKMIRSHLDPIMETHGYAMTRTPKDGFEREHRFNRAFGFKVCGEDEFFTLYKLEPKCRL